MTKQLLTLILSAFLIGYSNVLVFAGTYKIENKIERTMDIQALLQEYIDDNDAVGASIGLIDHGTITTFSCGKKSIDKDEAVSENTIFEIGSITKVFTTIALMDMITKGSFQLDDPIELHLPGVKVPEMDGKKITLRHLATHHSGLPYMPTNFNPKNSLNPFEYYSVENLYDFLNHYNLTNAPGIQFEYSNVGMGLLGHILCLKTGKSYEQLILDTILKKLGMQNTGISLTQETLKESAKGHHLGQITEYWDFTQAIVGAGALRSNVKDMTTFLAANMGLLSSPINDLLKKCQSQQYSAGSGTNIGLGWILSHSDHADVIWHNGGTGGFRSFLGFNPETEKGVVILSNSTEGWPEQLGLRLLDPESYKKPIVDVMLGKDLDYLKRFEGTYEIITKDQPITEIKLRLSESKLIYVVPGGEIQIIPESLCIFSLKGVVGQKLQFILDDDGKVIKAQMLAFPSNNVITEILRKPQEG